MYVNSEYTHFSLIDVTRFEKWLYKWCTTECIHGRSMIVFDRERLLVEGKRTTEVKDNQVFHYLALPNISLEYICVNKSMCILTKVWENKTLSVLYNVPKSWHNVEVWPAT